MGWLWLRCCTTHGIEASGQMDNQANQTRGKPWSVVFCVWSFNKGQGGSHDRVYFANLHAQFLRSSPISRGSRSRSFVHQFACNKFHRRNNNYSVHFPDSVIATTLPSKYGHETVARQTTKIRQHQTGSGGRCHHNSSSPSTTTKTNYPDPTSARHYTALPRRRGRSA